jgi:hypothetical protein
VANGLVEPSGTILPGSTTGPVPTITHTGAGTYTFSIAGLGTGCPLPALTTYSGPTTAVTSFAGGSCGPGTLTTTVYTNGGDGYWSYLLVGAGAAPAGALQMRAVHRLPRG